MKVCEKKWCMFCKTFVACGFWHNVKHHNEPPLWGHTREQADKELEYHLRSLWGHIKEAVRGESRLDGTNSRDLIILSNNEDVETH